MMNDARLNGAGARWDGTSLTVTGECFERRWRLTANGLRTVDLRVGNEAMVEDPGVASGSDWRLYELVDGHSRAELLDANVRAMPNPSLIGPHVSTEVVFAYPDVEILVRYAAQVFACGIRTQLSVRGMRPFDRSELPSHLLQSHAEHLRFDATDFARRAAGYYNDLQHRNHDDTVILKEVECTGGLANGSREVYDWANLLVLTRDGVGLIAVKESHKCVNQAGIDTGEFVLDREGLRVTGLGLTSSNYLPKALWLPHDRWQSAWATWTIPFLGEESEAQWVLKRFDRARFAPQPEALLSRSNTWGTRPPGDEARAAATEIEVLREVEACARLGIDAVAIDDGWQYPLSGRESDAVGNPDEWRPHPARFPGGWTTIRRAARERGVLVDLWIAGARASLEQIIRNIEEGGFSKLKIDFLNLQTRDQLDAVLEKIRRLVMYFPATAVGPAADEVPIQISWDVTENAPRLGYFFAREYGSLHVANRKPTYDCRRVRHIAYTPRLVLRDTWHLSRFVNLNQIEIPIQDVSRMDSRISNASEYSQAYCTAISLMGLPLFFMEAHTFPETAMREVSDLMKLWRRERSRIATGHVFPIGSEPCDAAITGFQCHGVDGQSGYLLVFREARAAESDVFLTLHFLRNLDVRLEDLMTDESSTAAVDDNGKLRIIMPSPASFRWLKYTVEDN